MADRFVRITLERQYVNEGGEPQHVISLRYGTEPAVRVGEYVADPGGGEAVPVSGRAMFGQERQGAPAQFLPGKPIIYEMNWSREDGRCAIVPDYVAMNYFGDWTIHSGQAMSTPERTHPAEKRRVAALWHDYKREQRNANIPNHWRNLKKIAPPCVPHVVIHLLDSAYRSIPNFEYRPWDHFKWEQDCIKLAPEPMAAPVGMVMPNGMPFDMSALIQQMVEEQVAAALAKPTASRKAA